MKIITIEHLTQLIHKHGFENFIKDLIEKLKQDFARWDEFTKMPRPAMHVPGGVLELMPVCDDTYYTYKYVNCHPKNPETGKMTVAATGQLSTIDTGYPLMYSEMTLLTAFRTAATSSLATNLMARKNAKVMAIIGTGAQSEFQVRGAKLVRDIQEVRYFDIDPKAMDKFEQNMSDFKTKLTRCSSAEQAVRGADIITVCTACKANVDVIKNGWIKEGVHINALGGDTIGKTELELSILPRAKIVVEYFDHSIIEGEIQRLTPEQVKTLAIGELYELITGTRQGRASDRDITIFDSVGIALEDYSALTLTYELAERYSIGEEKNFTPNTNNPKNLISTLAR